MTWEELWEKYEKKIRAEDPTLEGEDLKTSVCLRILEKSCCTSEVFNNLSGCSELNTFLPSTDSITAANAGSSTSSTSDGVDCADDLDLLEGLEVFPSKRMPSTAAAEGADDQTSDDGASALELAYAAERAAACAGALRLTRLVKPFPQKQDEQPSDRTPSSGEQPSDLKQSGGEGVGSSGGGGDGGGGGSRLSRLVPLLRAERTEAKEQKRADQRLRKMLGKRKFPRRSPRSSAA